MNLQYILIALLFISCNNKKETLEKEIITPKIEMKKSWYQAFSLSEEKNNKDLKLSDIKNLDKLNGFRNALFNTNINTFDYTDKRIINGDCSNLNYNLLRLGFFELDREFRLANGKISNVELTFLQQNLKLLILNILKLNIKTILTINQNFQN